MFFLQLSAAVKDFDNLKLNDLDALNLNIFHNHLNSLIIIDLTFYYEDIENFKSDTIYAYWNIIITMFSEFKNKLSTNYQKKLI